LTWRHRAYKLLHKFSAICTPLLVAAVCVVLASQHSTSRNLAVSSFVLMVGVCLMQVRTILHKTYRHNWTPLFVYGTLKSGMYWNRKFLSLGAEFLAPATTVDRFPLVTGKCGVPYLLVDHEGKGHQVRGELWLVDAETIEGLDQYEGLVKGYYTRREVRLDVGRLGIMHAHVYGLQRSSPCLLSLPHLEVYDSTWHQFHYRAVEHILLKQKMYLQGFPQYCRKGVLHPICGIKDDACTEPHLYKPRLIRTVTS